MTVSLSRERAVRSNTREQTSASSYDRGYPLYCLKRLCLLELKAFVHESTKVAPRTNREQQTKTQQSQRGQHVWVAAFKGVATKVTPPIIGQPFYPSGNERRGNVINGEH